MDNGDLLSIGITTAIAIVVTLAGGYFYTIFGDDITAWRKVRRDKRDQRKLRESAELAFDVGTYVLFPARFTADALARLASAWPFMLLFLAGSFLLTQQVASDSLSDSSPSTIASVFAVVCINVGVYGTTRIVNWVARRHRLMKNQQAISDSAKGADVDALLALHKAQAEGTTAEADDPPVEPGQD